MRKTLIALFVIYLALLVWVILWKAHLPFIGRDDMREIKLVPFVSGEGYGSSAPVELLVNLLLFVPLGMYLAALRARLPALIVIGVSVALEIAQFVLATGSSDVTDVIVNTAGGLIGLGLFTALRPKLPALVGVLGVANVLALVAIAVYTRSFPVMPPGGGVVIQSFVTF